MQEMDMVLGMDETKQEEDILQIEDLSVSYNKGEPALKHVSLAVRKGSILVIVGESGSGKSTLIRAVAGLLSAGGEIEGGRILFQQEDITQHGASLMRSIRGSRIAMIFQDARASLNPRRKIGSQFIESLRSSATLSAVDARLIALAALADIHVPDPLHVMNSYPFELSGGMCQRVTMAMAISEFAQPKLLLADEPTSALDVTIQAQIIRRILGYRERFGVSIAIQNYV